MARGAGDLRRMRRLWGTFPTVPHSMRSHNGKSRRILPDCGIAWAARACGTTETSP